MSFSYHILSVVLCRLVINFSHFLLSRSTGSISTKLIQRIFGKGPALFQVEMVMKLQKYMNEINETKISSSPEPLDQFQLNLTKCIELFLGWAMWPMGLLKKKKEIFFSTPEHRSDKLYYSVCNHEQRRFSKIVNFISAVACILHHFFVGCGLVVIMKMYYFLNIFFSTAS